MSWQESWAAPRKRLTQHPRDTSLAMSKENVEIVRAVYEEGYAKRTVDLPSLRALLSPDYRFHTRPGWPGQAVYRLDEMTTLWADLDATLTDHSLVPTHYEAIGTYVLVTLQQTARLRGSNQELNETIYQLWLLTEGTIQETWTYTQRAEALEAAGLA
jgi:ketosteroid isomerase-like protein